MLQNHFQTINTKTDNRKHFLITNYWKKSIENITIGDQICMWQKWKLDIYCHLNHFLKILCKWYTTNIKENVSRLHNDLNDYHPKLKLPKWTNTSYGLVETSSPRKDYQYLGSLTLLDKINEIPSKLSNIVQDVLLLNLIAS